MKVNKRKIISGIGVIVLGALGSGLWELLKPAMSGIWGLLLDVATLGMSSLRDSIYVDAALSNATGVRVLAVVLLIAALMLLMSILPAVIRGVREPLKNPDWFIVLMPLVLASLLMVGGVRLAYVAKVAAHIERLSKIANPYMDEREFRLVISDVARSRTRAEFVVSIDKLQGAIKKAGIAPPELELY